MRQINPVRAQRDGASMEQAVSWSYRLWIGRMQIQSQQSNHLSLGKVKQTKPRAKGTHQLANPGSRRTMCTDTERASHSALLSLEPQSSYPTPSSLKEDLFSQEDSRQPTVLAIMKVGVFVRSRCFHLFLLCAPCAFWHVN
jgi:hypothetical protein